MTPRPRADVRARQMGFYRSGGDGWRRAQGDVLRIEHVRLGPRGGMRWRVTVARFPDGTWSEKVDIVATDLPTLHDALDAVEAMP